jgi:hypothetical protein
MGKAKKAIVLTFLCILVLAFPVYISWAATTAGTNFYLPIINKAELPTATNTLPPPTPTNTLPPPTATNTQSPPTATNTQSPPTPTNTESPPTPTWTTEPPHNTGNVVITTIFYDGSGQNEPDEYVEIRNDDAFPIQLANWTLRDDANHIFTFPSFVIQQGQVCRVYTNQDHPESCGFNYHSGSAIWNNTGDCGYLRDSANTLIDQYCY